jgi:hypothetical protein
MNTRSPRKEFIMSNAIDTFFSPFRQTVDHFWNMPVTNWNRFFNPQFTLNYNDAGVENHVLSQVGSYGSQLSTLIDMIAVLKKNLPENLSAREQCSVKEFDRLCEDSKRAVAEYRGDDRAIKSEQILSMLEKLKNDDRAEFDSLSKKIASLMN